jgi:hypothetical protein
MPGYACQREVIEGFRLHSSPTSDILGYSSMMRHDHFDNKLLSL